MTGRAGDPLECLARAAAEWGAPLEPAALAKLADYLRFVQTRNARVNLTADDSWEALVLKHGADGLLAAAALRRELVGRPAPKLLDLGAGAGFVGVAIKLAWPQAEVTMLESVERKYRFLSAAAERLAVPGLRVLRRRAGCEPLGSYETGRDAVIARAVAPLPEALPLAWPMLAPEGLFAAFQTAEPDQAEPALARALAATGARVLKSIAYHRPGEPGERRLLFFGRAKSFRR